MSPKKICLLTTAHLTDNPRLVKEADALCCFGYEVMVIACHYNPGHLESDRKIMQRATWSVIMVSWDPIGNPWLFWLSRVRRIGCHFTLALLQKLGIPRGLGWLEVRAFDRVLPEIMREARKVNADLFIGHNPGLLPIAWKVANDYGAKCGFDAEDYHSGMDRIGETCSLQDKIVRGWEKNHLNRYDYLTTAAPLIAREYVARYSISFDAVVLNAFNPVCVGERKSESADNSLSLYWISQTIGAHRGLEDVLRALALLKEAPVRFFLRGDWQNGYATKLRRLAGELRIPQSMIVSLPRVAFDDCIRSATQYDVGLAVEEPISRNKELCVSNKILMYLSAGLAVAASATPGQTELMEQIPGAGFIFPCGDHRSLARNLKTWIENPDLLDKAKAAAFQAAQERFNWKRERAKFIDTIDRVLR